MRSLGGRGDRADFEPAPDAIAPAGDDAVDRVGKICGYETEHLGDGGPWLG